MVYDKFLRDPQITIDRSSLFLNALKLYHELNLADKNLFLLTIHALNNVTIANGQLDLPEFDKNALWTLTNATQMSKDIVDFSPLIIRDAIGKRIVIQSKNIARDHWMITNFLKNRPEIANQTEKHEWINAMIKQLSYNIFDDHYGPKYFDKKSYSPTDQKVWKIILGLHDYMNALPDKLKRDNIPIAFPYWNSSLLKDYIADRTNRSIALLYLADLPAKTFDLQRRTIVFGIRGMEKFVEQLPKEYEEIKSLYPDGKVGRWNEDPRNFYYGWLGDRGGHGLNNTVYQFIGIKSGEGGTWERYIKLVPQRFGIDQFLTKTWKPWDLIKFIYGYESFKAGDWGGEWETYRYGLPLAFKAFGIPYGATRGTIIPGLYTNPDPYLINAGAPTVDWAVTLPDKVVDNLKNNFHGIIIGYGNYFGLHSCKDGLIKDSSGVNSIYQHIRGKTVYLWKK